MFVVYVRSTNQGVFGEVSGNACLCLFMGMLTALTLPLSPGTSIVPVSSFEVCLSIFLPKQRWGVGSFLFVVFFVSVL